MKMIDGTAALRFDLIDDVPWDRSPAFAFSNSFKAYNEAFKNVIDVIPTKDLKISFSDDVWDFNSYYTDSQPGRQIFNFKNLPDELAERCKFFVLLKISEKTKITTANNRFTCFKRTLIAIFEKTDHKSIYTVTTEDIINEMESLNAKTGTKYSRYQGVFQMYYFLMKHYKMELPVDLELLEKVTNKYKKKSKIDVEKVPDIPLEYFKIIRDKSLEVMRDTTVETDDRMIGASIVFLSQTGLRLGDFLSLQDDRLFSMKLPKSGFEANFIHYSAKKPSKAHQPLLEFDIFSNSLTTEAFQLMKELRNSSPLAKDSKTLFVMNNPLSRRSSCPHTGSQYHKRYEKFFYKYLPVESTREWKDITPVEFFVPKCYRKKGDPRYIKLYVPETRQYRVRVCTDLYNKGVNLVYIRDFMGHLSEYMTGYYVRPKDTYQENIQYAEEVLLDITMENVSLMGGSNNGDVIKENINSFISGHGYNVKKDISAILKAFGDKVVIRGKTGGVCIKTSLVPCSKDARTNEVMCAYNLCPNLFHTYYMVDVTYVDFRTLQQTYKHNLDNGFVKEAQKQLLILKDLLHRRLIPELDELEREIGVKGIRHILDRHPGLLMVIENLKEIREEVELWRMKQ